MKKAYPKANYRVESGYGHLTYACKNTEVYVEWMKEICKDRKNSLRSDYNKLVNIVDDFCFTGVPRKRNRKTNYPDTGTR